MPVVEERKPLPRLPEFVAHLIKPRAETIAPPSFTVATETPPPRGSLSPSAAETSPMVSGAPGGTAMGQGGTADGANGNGAALAGCYDAVWAQAVTDRVGKFFFYPRSERDRHVSGAVFVHIGIRRNGRVSFLKVNRSSGVRALDEAALQMVRTAAPLPRIPDRMHVDRIEVELPIVFGDVDKSLIPSSGDCAPAPRLNRET
jgi:protein TonB